MSDVTVERVIERFSAQLNESGLPITFFAFDGHKPVGMCTLRINDGIRPELKPWLGSLVVDPFYQKQGIGKRLIDVVMKQAKELGFEKLYLFAFDKTLLDYYAGLGSDKIGIDVFKNHPVTVMEYTLSAKENTCEIYPIHRISCMPRVK